MISPIVHLHLGTAVNRPGVAKRRNKASRSPIRNVPHLANLVRANTWQHDKIIDFPMPKNECATVLNMVATCIRLPQCTEGRMFDKFATARSILCGYWPP